MEKAWSKLNFLLQLSLWGKKNKLAPAIYICLVLQYCLPFDIDWSDAEGSAEARWIWQYEGTDLYDVLVSTNPGEVKLKSESEKKFWYLMFNSSIVDLERCERGNRVPTFAFTKNLLIDFIKLNSNDHCDN